MQFAHRSPARIRYSKPAGAYQPRRAMPARGRNNDAPRLGFRERVLVQAMICGGVLAVLLVFNLVNNAFTNTATAWVSRNISHNLIADAPLIVDDWMNRFLGREEYEPEVIPVFEQTAPAVNQPISSPPERIDENMLEQIRNRPDPYLLNNPND